MLYDLPATNFADSFALPPSAGAAQSLLVRVYPVTRIEPPHAVTEQPQLVGRDPSCTLVLPGDGVSRRHAAIDFNGHTHVVTDLGSTNGTFVNEARLTAPRPLAAGDQVRFGNQIFRYLGAGDIESQYHEVVFKLMTCDGLTGVHNKRFLLEALERELQLARRSEDSLALMLLDLDKFKAINDCYGHLAGDAVLVEFSRRTRSTLRSGELLARYGGEEFAILLVRTSRDDALRVAERVREAAAAAPMLFEGQAIPVTVSIGVCLLEGGVEASPSTLLAAADRQLYAAKRGGRNQVQFQHGLSTG